MVIFRFRGYFGHFWISGVFWSFLGFRDILVIFRFRGILVIFRFRGYFGNLFGFWGYFGHFLGFGDILVIFWVSGVMIPSKISKLVSIKR